MSKKYAEKAIIFARVSTAEQKEDQHLSLPAQTRILREYVDKGGKFGTIKEVIAEHELDESASKSNRRKFDEAFKIVEEAEEPIAIIVERVDRFQRDFRRQSNLMS